MYVYRIVVFIISNNHWYCWYRLNSSSYFHVNISGFSSLFSRSHKLFTSYGSTILIGVRVSASATKVGKVLPSSTQCKLCHMSRWIY